MTRFRDEDRPSAVSQVELLGAPSADLTQAAAQSWLQRVESDRPFLADIIAITRRAEQSGAASGHGLSQRAACGLTVVKRALAVYAELTAAAQAVLVDPARGPVDRVSATVAQLQMAAWACRGAAYDLRAAYEVDPSGKYAYVERLAALAADRAGSLMLPAAQRPIFAPAANLAPEPLARLPNERARSN